LSQPLLLRGALAGSPAEAAGITAGDKLLSLNGAPVSTRADVQAQLADTRPGDTIQVGLQRAGSSVTCNVRLLSFKEAVVLRTRMTTEGATQ
jgi:S1-C subfamily serine protease